MSDVSPHARRSFRHRALTIVAYGLTLFAATLVRPVPAHSAGLLVAQGRFGGSLEIVEHSARVTINNGIAVTEVRQVFRNTENRQLEAFYSSSLRSRVCSRSSSSMRTRSPVCGPPARRSSRVRERASSALASASRWRPSCSASRGTRIS